MANSCAFHCSVTLQALVSIFISLAAVHVADAGGQDRCPPFSCGGLHNILYPFRRPGDPPECGVKAYELLCSSSKATIHIAAGTYFVTSINYTDKSFWVVDANLDVHCPLPRPDQLPYGSYWKLGLHYHSELVPDTSSWACFVNCSQAVTNTSWDSYKPVTCLSTNSSFVYVSISGCQVNFLEPSCRCLAAVPLGSRLYPPYQQVQKESYAEIIELVKKGFSVSFPIDYYRYRYKRKSLNSNAKSCLNDTKRFVLLPLAVFTFLAHKYWKTRISIDAVEKFLRMLQMVGPTRYAYTDITAITSHFRDKLGQGGYGSVYKGVLHPGDVHVAIKMLGNSNCNGDEFISEVSTIGRIHHAHQCSSSGRLLRRGNEKGTRVRVHAPWFPGQVHILTERSFSWDKLTEIALGIARGINYLHQGCDMQILHFDIKPHNILLDNNFVPKVADFGLAKLYPRDTSFVPASALRGTIGCIAPEMISRSFGVISSKSDVYSFGMLLLEMAGGRRNADQNAGSSSQAYYPSWVYDRLAEQEVGEITAADDMHELERKLCIVGLRCIQMKPHDRPTMSEVIEMFECGASGLQVPSRPFFCDDEQIAVADSYHFSEPTTISEEDE